MSRRREVEAAAPTPPCEIEVEGRRCAFLDRCKQTDLACRAFFDYLHQRRGTPARPRAEHELPGSRMYRLCYPPPPPPKTDRGDTAGEEAA